MADQTDTQSSHIEGGKLGTVLGLLASTYLLNKLRGSESNPFYNQGILMRPGSIRSLGGPRSTNPGPIMHPGPARYFGVDDPTSQSARLAQRALDDSVIRNYNSLSRLNNQADIDALHHSTGWQLGPWGLGRELSDENARVDPITGTFIHPSGDVLGVHNIQGPFWMSPRNMAPYNSDEGYTNFLGHFGQNNSRLPDLPPTQNILTLNSDMKLPFDQFRNKYSSDMPELDRSDYPYSRLPAATAAQEAQYGIQNFEQRSPREFTMYSPTDEEANTVKFRALHPESYIYPFNRTMTTDYDEFRDILNRLRQTNQ